MHLLLAPSRVNDNLVTWGSFFYARREEEQVALQYARRTWLADKLHMFMYTLVYVPDIVTPHIIRIEEVCHSRLISYAAALSVKYTPFSSAFASYQPIQMLLL